MPSLASVRTLATQPPVRGWNEALDPRYPADGLTLSELELIEAAGGHRRTLRRGEVLILTGMPFRSIYALRQGSFKSRFTSEGGKEQIAAFYMAGDLLGVDAIGAEVHNCDVVAIENSEVYEIAYGMLLRLMRAEPTLQRQIHRLISREMQRDQGVVLLLGSMRAGQKLAMFLLGLSHRLAIRGCSPTRITLRMTREEIGNYLGMTIETVSRTLTRLEDEGMIIMHGRDAELCDIDRLRRLISTPAYRF